MKVKLLHTPSIDVALFGLGKNKGVTTKMSFEEFCQLQNGDLHPKYKQMMNVANKLAEMPEEHRKFLRQITFAIEVTAPRYWWSEFDTYKIGTTAQSESTMHTILKNRLSYENFADGTDDYVLDKIIDQIDVIKQFDCTNTEKTMQIKKILPESFLQCRVVTLNYEVFKNIYRQRKNHRLPEWRKFCNDLLYQLVFWHWIVPNDDIVEV